MVFPSYTYFLCYFNHYSITVLFFPVVSFIHLLFLLPCVHGTAFVLLVDGWQGRGTVYWERVRPHLLCYVQNNFKILQFIFHRAWEVAGVLKLPEWFWPLFTLLKFNSFYPHPSLSSEVQTHFVASFLCVCHCNVIVTLLSINTSYSLLAIL